jgi:hypothetical protein
MPNSPMITAMKGSPEFRSLMPKTNRASPVIGSRPIVARASPARPASTPLSTDFDEIEIITVSPNMTSANISAGPNSSAKEATGWAARTKRTSDSRMPTVVTTDDITSARPARPCLAIGYPSNEVAMAAGVPGVLTRMAGIRSP